MNKYCKKMDILPKFHEYGKIIILPENGYEIFLYDTCNISLPACLLIHGLSDEADTWRHVIGPLSKYYRVIALDLPGFGRSSKLNIQYDAPFLVDTIMSLIKILSIKDITILGSSMGGMLSHYISLEYPGLVKKLILVSGQLLMVSQKPSKNILLFLIPGIGEYIYNRLRKNPDAAFESLQGYYNSLDDIPDSDRNFLYQRVNERLWDNRQKQAFFSILRNLGPWVIKKQNGLQQKLAQMAIPTLIIWGDNDKIISFKNGKALSAIQPSSKLIVIKNAGHLPHQEQPERFLGAIL